MTPFEAATLASNIAIGLGQIGIVWYAIRAMTRSAKDRGDDYDKRHAETMAALEIQRQALEFLIIRTGQAQPAS